MLSVAALTSSLLFNTGTQKTTRPAQLWNLDSSQSNQSWTHVHSYARSLASNVRYPNPCHLCLEIDYREVDGIQDLTFNFSTIFATHVRFDGRLPRLILVTPDEPFFAVHFHALTRASNNEFGGLLTGIQEPLGEDYDFIAISEESDVLNVILHCIYNIPCDSSRPTLQCIERSLLASDKYGLSMEQYMSRGSLLYNTVLIAALFQPFEVYALAASHELEELAVAASSYTLTHKLHHVPQHIADKMGTKYLQRLYQLHGTRMDALKAMLDEKPYPHEARQHCSVVNRQATSKAYELAAAQVAYVATPALPHTTIELIMNGLADAVGCPDCKATLISRAKAIVTGWMLLKRTI